MLHICLLVGPVQVGASDVLRGLLQVQLEDVAVYSTAIAICYIVLVMQGTCSEVACTEDLLCSLTDLVMI